MNEMRKRMFVAVELSAAAKEALVEVTGQVAHGLPPMAVRWVAAAQMHLTLKFLGDTAVSVIPRVQQQLDGVTADWPAFSLRLGALGAFPHRQRPRVIWVDLAGEEDALAQMRGLQQAVEGAVVDLGWEREKRPFRPHLTLGRVKDAVKLERVNWGVAVPAVVVPVTAVVLIESRLTPQGPIYTRNHISYLNSGAVG